MLGVGLLMAALRFSSTGMPLDIAYPLAAGRHHERLGTVHDQLRARLGDGWPLVRARAVMALGKIDDPKDLNVLWDLRRDDDPRVRMEVVLALRNGGRLDKALEEDLNSPNRAFDGRVELLQRLAEEAVTDIQREDVRRALAEIKHDLDQWITFDLGGTVVALDPTDAPLLDRVLKYLCLRGPEGVRGDELPKGRCAFGEPWWPLNVTGALIAFSARFRTVIEKALDGTPTTALVAALGESDDLSWAPRLRRMLSSRDSNLQATAAQALGQLGDQASIPDLRKLLGSPKVGVALAAMASLSSLLGDRAAPDFAFYLRRVADADLRQVFEDVRASKGVLLALQHSPRHAVRALAVEFLDSED